MKLFCLKHFQQHVAIAILHIDEFMLANTYLNAQEWVESNI
jgi:hypothetical protein